MHLIYIKYAARETDSSLMNIAILLQGHAFFFPEKYVFK